MDRDCEIGKERKQDPYLSPPNRYIWLKIEAVPSSCGPSDVVFVTIHGRRDPLGAKSNLQTGVASARDGGVCSQMC